MENPELEKNLDIIAGKIATLMAKAINDATALSSKEAAVLAATAVTEAAKLNAAAVAESARATDHLRLDIDYMKKDIGEIKVKLDSHYVTKEEFDTIKNNHVTKEQFGPVKNIVYGMVGTVLLAVLGALIALVVIRQ